MRLSLFATILHLCYTKNMSANEKSHQGSRAWWASMSPEEKAERSRKANVARWANTTPEERKAHSKKMNKVI